MNVAVDHIVIASPDLESGMDAVKQRLGVRPVFGGRHPGFGTHNALLGLGPGTYLEVVAPDPEGTRPAQGYPFGIDSGVRLATWALRTTDIAAASVQLAESEVHVGSIMSGSRRRPDGSTLSWRLSDPWCFPFEGMCPFLIDWGTSTHPSTSLPEAGRLKALTIEHPRSDVLAGILAGFDSRIRILSGESSRLTARIDTVANVVDLF